MSDVSTDAVASDQAGRVRTITDTRKSLTFVRSAWNQCHSERRPFCPSELVPDTEYTIIGYCTYLVKEQLKKRRQKADRTRQHRERK